MKIKNTVAVVIIGALFACETPTQPSAPLVDSFAAARESGVMSIAGPQGVAHGEFSIEADFQARKGKWTLKVIDDSDGFLESENGLVLYGDRTENGDHIFTDVENYLGTRDRDPAVAVYFSGGRMSKIVYGNWPTFVSNSRDQMQKIKRYAGSYSVTQDGESIPIDFSFVINWNQEPAKGSYWQTHIETEGTVPERVAIADGWSFTSSEIRAETGKCKGCKQIAVYKQREDETGKMITDDKSPAVTIDIGSDQKIQSLTAGDVKAKLAK